MSGGQRTAAVLEAVDTMPAWGRKTVYIAGGLLFASGLGMSGFFLTLLAAAFRISLPFALLLPLALDAGAAVGVVMWVTGTGAIEKFGKSLARLLFGLSILGNGLERVLTFAPIPEPAAGTDAFAILVERTNALTHLLTTGQTTASPPQLATAVVEIAVGGIISAWFLLAVSTGIGIVFPILAYKMSHGIILARKAADAPPPRHKRPVPAVETKPEKGGWLARLRKDQDDETPAAPATTQPDPVPAAAVATAEPVTAPTEMIPAVAAKPLPYVHDSRDLEPNTPEWKDRYDRLPGGGKQAKLEHWLTEEWRLGREPNLARVADRVVDGSRTAQNAKTALVKRGILPPSQRPAPVTEPAPEVEEVTAANAAEEVRDEVRDPDHDSQDEVREPTKLARVV